MIVSGYNSPEINKFGDEIMLMMIGMEDIIKNNDEAAFVTEFKTAFTEFVVGPLAFFITKERDIAGSGITE